MHVYIFAETRGDIFMQLNFWDSGVCVLVQLSFEDCTYVRKLVWFVCLFVASFVSRLVQEDTFVASACWRKPGLAAAEDTRVEEEEEEEEEEDTSAEVLPVSWAYLLTSKAHKEIRKYVKAKIKDPNS